MKPKGIVYEHFTILQEQDRVTYKCIYCGKIYTCRNATRMSNHIASCEKCPTMVKIIFVKKTTPGNNTLNDSTQAASSSILKALQDWQANKQGLKNNAERDQSNRDSEHVTDAEPKAKKQIEVVVDPDPLSDSFDDQVSDDSIDVNVNDFIDTSSSGVKTEPVEPIERVYGNNAESSPASNSRLLEAILACMTRQVAAQEAQVRALDSLALAQKEQALAQKEQALAQKEQALAQKEQAIAQKEQARAQLEQTRALDRIAQLMERQKQ